MTSCRTKEFPSLRRSVQLALDCARGIAYLHNHHPLSIIHRCVQEYKYLTFPFEYLNIVGCRKHFI
jgi:hypothetical protein